MSNFFKTIGLLGLLLFCFIYSNETIAVIKEQDEIMIKIKENYDNYNILAKDSIINSDTIIPGINGRKVNIEKSYDTMKKIGIYNENYYVYDIVVPKNSLKNNKDKYIISGNKSIDEISLVFIVDNIENINQILNILNKEQVNAYFFVDSNFIKIDNTYEFKNNRLSYYDNNYDDLILNNRIINNRYNQYNKFCYFENKNSKKLNICKNNGFYSFIPNIVIKDNMYNKIRKNIKNGSIIAIYTSNIDELNLSIKYIKSKGYNIVLLDEIVDET